MEVLFLDTDDVDGLASPAEYVQAVRSGYAQRGRGAPTKPPKLVSSDLNPSLKLITYSAILPDDEVMGGYMYTVGDVSWYVTPLFDAVSGKPLAVIDGAYMNPIKTGAAGGVGVDALARRDAKVLAVLGSGMQAEGQVRAIDTVRDLQQVKIYSPTAENRQSLARRLDADLDTAVVAVDGNAAALDGADIVVTATNATSPILHGGDLRPGMHVNLVGGHGKVELDPSAIERAKYVPDLRERAVEDIGGFFQAMEAGVVDEDHIHAELGDIVAGTAPGRESPEEITVFDSTGSAIETVAAANLLYESAVEGNKGTTLNFRSREEIYE